MYLRECVLGYGRDLLSTSPMVATSALQEPSADTVARRNQPCHVKTNICYLGKFAPWSEDKHFLSSKVGFRYSMSPDVLSSVCKQQSANEAMAQLIEVIKVQYFRCSLPWRMIVGHGQLLFQIRASAHIVLSFTILVACCYAMFLCFVQIRQNSLSSWLDTWKPGPCR